MMLKRLWRFFVVRFRARSANDLLEKAQRELQELRTQQRAQSAQVIKDRNDSELLIQSTQRYIEELKVLKELSADAYETRRIGKEIAEYEEYLAIKQRRLEHAVSVLEEGRAALQRGERRIREKTAETLAAAAQWNESAIERKMRQDMEENLAIFDRYQSNPCPKTLAPLLKMQEVSRENVAQAERACENLTKMVPSLETTIETLRRKAAAAQAKGDSEKAESILREQRSFEQSLVSVQESVQQAEETVTDCHTAYARLEAFLAREAARFAAEDP